MSLCMQAVDIPWSRLVFCPCHRRRWTQSHQDDPYILLLSSWYPPYHMSVSTAIQQSKQNRLIWTRKTFHVWAYMYFGYVRSWNSQGIFGDMLNSRVVKIKIRFFLFSLGLLRRKSIATCKHSYFYDRLPYMILKVVSTWPVGRQSLNISCYYHNIYTLISKHNIIQHDTHTAVQLEWTQSGHCTDIVQLVVSRGWLSASQ